MGIITGRSPQKGNDLKKEEKFFYLQSQRQVKPLYRTLPETSIKRKKNFYWKIIFII